MFSKKKSIIFFFQKKKNRLSFLLFFEALQTYYVLMFKHYYFNWKKTIVIKTAKIIIFVQYSEQYTTEHNKTWMLPGNVILILKNGSSTI